ncbi:MAG: hypothetical protein ACE5HV_03605 [Acidobacteriota bacterium]
MSFRHIMAAVASLLIAGLALAGAASADTIYMKNGRLIRSSSVRVEGDRVVFLQYGGQVAIPLSLVDKIVEDDTAGPEATAPAPAPADEPQEENTPPGETPSDAAEGDTATPTQPQVPPEQTREYWDARLQPIFAQMSDIEKRIDRFRGQTGADARRQVSELESRLKTLEQSLKGIRTQARRAGVPPGWLRRPR